MDFKSICYVLGYEDLVDVAFGRASKKRPEEKVKFVSKTVRKHLNKVARSWPNLDELPPFYRELIGVSIDIEGLEKALAALKRSDAALDKLEKIYKKKLRKRMDKDKAYQLRRVYYGRVKAVLRQIRGDLEFLAEGRRRLLEFPDIQDAFTIVIAGLPNVGKSSLLRAMTSAEPRVESYPFTTQSILLGYFEERHLRYQIIDTPGLLDRPLEDRNPIEKQAVLALRHLADVVLYIFDPSETCGYTAKEQLNVFQEIVANFSLPVMPLVNKIDLIGEKAGKEFLESENLRGFLCSTTERRGVDTLKKEIIKLRAASEAG
jgi:nucleolar GTP-binding protein